MAIQTFELITPFQNLVSRDFTVSDNNFVVPNHADRIFMGEFVQLDSSYKLIRGTGDGVKFAVFAESGRYDAQASRKLPTLFLGGYEADTLIFNSSSAPALGAKLEVADITYLTYTLSGLQTHAGGTKEVIGFVTKTAASNSNKLRFMQTLV
ncbi:MAG: hypothetical protein ACFFD4_39850 [Candidatus Odinarchaeota archaeon]